MLGVLKDSFLSLTFPQPCHICSGHVERQADGVACSACWNSTRLFHHMAMLCDKCGALLGDQASPNPVFCHRCHKHYYSKARALGIYEKALAAAIIEMKHRPFIPFRIRAAVKEYLQDSDLLNTDILIPIPLARQRLSERGFNQAEIIARAISGFSGIPVDAFSLRRKVHTPLHRGGMDQKARELTVKRAFEVARPKCIEGKRLLLIDDVLTSGSTVSACAEMLLKSGAAHAAVFTLARAVFR